MDAAGRIKERLEERGMSTRELAKRTGIPVSTLYSFFKRGGNSIDIDSVIAIAHVLGTTADELLGVAPSVGRAMEYTAKLEDHKNVMHEDLADYNDDALSQRQQRQMRRLYAMYQSVTDGERLAIRKILGITGDL